MPENDNKSNSHLMTFLAILIILVMAILTAGILMRTGEISPEVLHAKPLKFSNPEYSRPQGPTISTSKSTVSSTTVVTKKQRNVCESPECITLAHQLHNWRDPSVDPCQDFFKATCGKYNEHSLVQGARVAKKTWMVEDLLKEFLLKNQSSTSKSENAMKMAYGKCTEYRDLNKNEKQVELWKGVFEDVQRIGSWPIIDKNWNESDFDLNDMMSKTVELGVPILGFFGIFFSEIPKMQILPWTVQNNPKFGEVIVDILIINNIQPDVHVITKDFLDVIELQRELGELSSNADDEEIGLSELQAQVPRIDFERIVKSLANPIKKNEIWSKVKNKIITKKHPIFFNHAKNLETILQTTSKRTLANFLIINFIYLNYLSDLGNQQKECAVKVIGDFPLAALRVFVRNHFDKENIHMVSEMVEDLKESFINVIRKSTWLHNETKKNAIGKVEKMGKLVGYPIEFEAPGALDKTFETLNLYPTDSYYTFAKKISKFEIERSINFVASVLSMKSDKNFLAANARYYFTRNYLTVNVPIMDDPFFDSTYPKYAKIASLGYVIAHEIGHGFDPTGRKRDENGEERDWWTSENSIEYDKRAQCFVEQYNEYDDPNYGKNLNGSKTIKEMVADIIGMEVAWNAYKKLDLSNEPSIIGFEKNYSVDKLFFQMTALTWCSPRDTAPLEKQVEQVHPTHNFRVNGLYSNMKSFAETFNCPVGTPMNPEKKCELF